MDGHTIAARTVRGGFRDDLLDGTNGDDLIYGFGGDDLLRGFGGRDLLLGGDGDDTLLGGSGNDYLEGQRGSDFIDGGAGIDVALFDGLRFADAFFTKVQGGYRVAGSAGTDSVSNVEILRFEDGDFRLDWGYFQTFGAAYRLYEAVLDREPDARGLDFYVSLLDRGAIDIFQMGSDMIQSHEFQSRFGSNLSVEEFVHSIYANVLDRAPDFSGYNFWVDAIYDGTVSRAEALVYISEDAENFNAVTPKIDDGYFLSDYGF